MSWKKLVIDDAQHEQRAIALSEQRRELAQKAPEVEEDKGDEAHRGTLAMMERFVESSRFEAVVAAVLISNSIFMGVQLQLAADSYGVASQTDIESDTAFVAVNTVYALLFTVELVFRIIAHRMSFFCTSDRASLFWNYLDISLVISSLLEVILVIAISVDGVDLGMSNRLRALRIIRLARLIRMMRAMRFFRGLRTLVYSIFYTLKALIWSLILLLMMMYLVGILLTDAVLAHVARFPTPDEIPVDSDEAVLYESFGSLHLAMHSLFRSITGGVDWAVYARAFAQVNWMWTYLFTSFIAFSVFAVLNVMTGVFCQRATELAERDKEAQLMAMQIETEHIMDEARRLFRSFDVVRQGSLTLMEVELMLQDEDVKAALAALDLVVYDPWRFFRLLDLNGNGAVTEEEFVEGCLRLRGPARTFDVASLAEENIRMKAKLASLEQQEVLSQQMISHFRVEMLQVGKLARQTSDYLNRCKASEKSVGYATSTEEEGPSMQDEGKQASKGRQTSPDSRVSFDGIEGADWTALRQASMRMAEATTSFATLMQQAGNTEAAQSPFDSVATLPSPPPSQLAPSPPMSQPEAIFFLEPEQPEGPVPERTIPGIPEEGRDETRRDRDGLHPSSDGLQPARRDRGSQGQGGTVAGQLQRDFDLPYFCDPEQ
ncbi:unnamed protein product [Durusdinium trenchii]